MRIARILCLCAAFLLAVFPDAAAAPDFSDWSAPENLGSAINSPYQDFGPALSKDGLSLYFTSDRPGGFGFMDLWVSQRPSRDDAWGTPMNLGGVINTAASENVPALSRDGHWLFFNSTRPGGLGGQDIWASWRANPQDDFAWETPFNLGPGVNSAVGDVNPSYFENANGGAPLLYFTSNRPGGPGLFDVYESQLGPDGVFEPATLVSELSSAAPEQMPSIRFDGLEIFFRRNPAGDASNGELWTSTRDTVLDPWSPPVILEAPINSDYGEQHVHIADRQTLYFSSDRPGGLGALDIYVTTRERERTMPERLQV